MTLRIAAFNVSSMALRLGGLLALLEGARVDIVVAQETRVSDMSLAGYVWACKRAGWCCINGRPQTNAAGQPYFGIAIISKWPLARINVDPEYGLGDARTIVARVHRPAPARPFNLLGIYLSPGYCTQEVRAGMIDKIMNWIPSHGDDCIAIGGWNEELSRSSIAVAVATGVLRNCDEVVSEPPRRRVGGRAMARSSGAESSTGQSRCRASSARHADKNPVSPTMTSCTPTWRLTPPCRRPGCGPRS